MGFTLLFDKGISPENSAVFPVQGLLLTRTAGFESQASHFTVMLTTGKRYLTQVGEKHGLLAPEGIEDFTLKIAVTCFQLFTIANMYLL